MKTEARLSALGIQLPSGSPPVANFQPVLVTGDAAYVSGQGPTRDGVPAYKGVVGTTVTEQDGYQAARLCTINALAALSAELGDLDKIRRVIKLLGFVASAPDFHRQPYVINGASDLLIDIFGDAGRHARSAIGTSVLPFNIPVEIEFIFQLHCD